MKVETAVRSARSLSLAMCFSLACNGRGLVADGPDAATNDAGTNDAAAPDAPDTGGASDAGEAGDSPADVGQPVCPMMPADLVSDFALDSGISPVSGRRGGWYLTGDPNGHFDPQLPAAGMDYPIDLNMGNPYCSGPGSLHTKATGFNVYGATLAVDFVPQVADMVKGSYDASQYRGVAFWARGAAPIKYVRVKFPDVYTDPDVAFPLCVVAAGFPNNCSPYMVKLDDGDYPGYLGARIDTTWRRFEILFADAAQDRYSPGYHRPPPNDKVDVQHLLGLAIEVQADFSTSPPSANDFEIWIDDVELVR
jgi:hypothetical protein